MNLMDLYIKIGTKDLSKTKKDINGISAYTIAAGNLMAKGVEKGARALIRLVKTAINSYADFQQYEGGVKKLFGEQDAKAVIENSKQAYKTAGMSANQYLDTVTTFSSKLISDLGGDTQKAVDYADRAIRAMSDNANTFGTDISLVQNAYAGFAKQNYTLLDNLKLGYGGTASEMARLINDSGVLGDTVTVTAGNINKVSFDTIIEAIEVTQTKMGITGATFQESETTISGSIDRLKGAWENFVTSLISDPENVAVAFDDLAEAAGIAWGNIHDAIETSVQSIKDLASDKVPWLSGVIQNLEVVIAALVAGFVALKATMGIQALISALTKSFYAYLAANEGATVAQWALNAALTANPIGLVVAAIAALVAAFAILWNTNEDFRNFWIETWDKIKNVASNAWEGIKSVFSTVGTFFKDTFSSAWNGIVSVFSKGGEIFNNIKDGIVETFKKVVNGLIDGINAVIAAPFNGLNSVLDKIHGIKIAGINPFSFLTWRATVPVIPHLEKGGILERGQIGLLEGNGAEAVVPLENNRKWISAVAQDMKKEMRGETIINITINGANYSDERSLADAVSRALQNALDRRNAAYA